jgi:hypothetical protein
MKIENNTVRLCCGGKGCPVVDVKGNKVIITDDYNNTIEISQEQAGMIKDAVKLLVERSDISDLSLE